MSPVSGRSDLDLGQLLNAISDPFSARKQLCRTPESLSTSLLISSPFSILSYKYLAHSSLEIFYSLALFIFF